jgi:hypothetical protein
VATGSWAKIEPEIPSNMKRARIAIVLIFIRVVS